MSDNSITSVTVPDTAENNPAEPTQVTVNQTSDPEQPSDGSDQSEKRSDDDTTSEEAPAEAVQVKIRINFRKILIISMTVVSMAVFITTAVLAIVGLTKELTREEIASKLTSALLATVFGNDSVEEVMLSSPISDHAGISVSDEKEMIPSLESDSGETPTDEVREVTMTLSNETPYEPDMNAILSLPRVIPAADELYAEYGYDAPVVLILHTHATEGYADTAENGYRTGDTSRSVVEIGRIVAERLDEAGINTIHSTTLFDADDFTLAYYNASLEIKKTLEEYPSISYIIDIHRDSIETADGEYYAPTASIDGTSAAQLMFVVGTDHGGSGHEDWENNLAVAARIQADIMHSYPTLMRSINLRSASFNEQYSSGSMLIEVGSCASTLDEAKVSVEILAEHLVKEILGN